MAGLVSRLGAFWRPRAGFDAPLPRPKTPICIVGDVHGRLDLLEALLVRIEAQPQARQARLIFVGDLVDRGPASAQVLKRVRDLTRANPETTISLMGNHERMMLDFLDDPEGGGPRWLTHGGAETLASFGLPAWSRTPDMTQRAQALRDALPDGLEDWLRALPLFWREEDLFVAHAGADPNLPPETQPPETLLWGHPAFLRQPRTDGIWVAHGHTIQPEVMALDGRIGTDTGAYRRGVLSAAWLDGDGLQVLTADVADMPV